MTDSQQPATGRNEPCPCKSGKKYKRCCGVDAAPKLTTPKQGTPSEVPGGVDPSQFDPAMLAQMSEMMKKLPKGQLQKIQALAQKAFSGKDISDDAKELEHTLPVEFQSMLGGFQKEWDKKAPKKTPNTDLQTPPVEEKKSAFSKLWSSFKKK